MGRRKLMVDPDESALLGSKYKCEYCRKTFYVPWRCTSWGWKMNGRMCCSYTCMRALERIRDEVDTEKKLADKTFQMYADWTVGMSWDEMERKWGETRKNIYSRLELLEAAHPKVCYRIRQENGGMARVTDTAGSSGGTGKAGGRPRKERDGEL